MLTLTCKLSELNEDGLFLARLLQNEALPTIQGATVQFNKFSRVSLKSTLTRTQRTEMFDGNGWPRSEPLSDEQRRKLEAEVSGYGDDDDSLYSFSPIVELYDHGTSCAHCRGIKQAPHPWRLKLGAEAKPADQINRVGLYFRWWIETGHFRPLSPRQPDPKTEQIVTALFGSDGDVPIDLTLENNPDARIQN